MISFVDYGDGPYVGTDTDFAALYGPQWPLDRRFEFDRWFISSGFLDYYTDDFTSLAHRASKPLLVRTTLLQCAMDNLFGRLRVTEFALIHAAEVTWATRPSLPLEFMCTGVSSTHRVADLHQIGPQVVDHNVHDAHRWKLTFPPPRTKLR